MLVRAVVVEWLTFSLKILYGYLLIKMAITLVVCVKWLKIYFTVIVLTHALVVWTLFLLWMFMEIGQRLLCFFV